MARPAGRRHRVTPPNNYIEPVLDEAAINVRISDAIRAYHPGGRFFGERPEIYMKILLPIVQGCEPALDELWNNYGDFSPPKLLPGELWKKPELSDVQPDPLDFVTPVLAYHPMDIREGGYGEFSAVDLYTGARFESPGSPVPGISTGLLAGPDHPIATAIKDARNNGTGVLRSRVGSITRKLLREQEGELWYYPFWEVPVRNQKKASVTHTVRFRIGEHEWKHYVDFEIAGFVLYDSTRGEEQGRAAVGVYFDRGNPLSTHFLYSMERMREKIITPDEAHRQNRSGYDVAQRLCSGGHWRDYFTDPNFADRFTTIPRLIQKNL